MTRILKGRHSIAAGYELPMRLGMTAALTGFISASSGKRTNARLIRESRLSPIVVSARNDNPSGPSLDLLCGIVAGKAATTCFIDLEFPRAPETRVFLRLPVFVPPAAGQNALPRRRYHNTAAREAERAPIAAPIGKRTPVRWAPVSLVSPAGLDRAGVSEPRNKAAISESSPNERAMA